MKKPFFLLSMVLIAVFPIIMQDSISEGAMLRKPEIDKKDKTEIKINFVVKENHITPNPEGWIEYSGTLYNEETGYGWLIDLEGNGRDRGVAARIELQDGTVTSAMKMGRLELANMQGVGKDNVSAVFRVDLLDGWYRITCSSVNPGGPLPVVDQRSFKCRAHDVVFAGANYGAPMHVKGSRLIEGTGLVEVTDNHLRIVVGDPSYSGWTWKYNGPRYKGWMRWIAKDHGYANGVRNKLSRRVDTGFHAIRMNALTIESAEPPVPEGDMFFRDYFNRDDSNDVSKGIVPQRRWIETKLKGNMKVGIYNSSIRLSAENGDHASAIYQNRINPGSGIIRYSTRVSTFIGEGSNISSGKQEMGIFLLGDPSGPNDNNSTFIGVSVGDRPSKGGFIYRVGDGKNGYLINRVIKDSSLLPEFIEGEYEIIVDHDVTGNVIRQIKINGIDVSGLLTEEELAQSLQRGLFGIRSAINNDSSNRLQHFYWYYRVVSLY